jgi:hypothetical protein
MATTRVISVDLVTKTPVTELEVSGLKYGQRLNGVAGLSGSVALLPPDTVANRARNSVINDAVDECRRLLVVERDGVVVADGIVWAAPYDDATQTRAITAASQWSIWRKRVVDARATFAGVDQLTIARAIIDAAQAVPGGDLGLVHNATLSGVTRDRTYESFEKKSVAEVIEQLAGVENGFDFAVDCHWDPAASVPTLISTFTLSYPRRGRAFAQTGHVFELGKNITSMTWPTDGTKTANKVWMIGSGQGADTLIKPAVDVSQIQPLAEGGPGYPLLETVIQAKSVKVPATLEAQALANLARSQPVVLPTIKVRADRDPILGSYIAGDAARIRVPPNLSPRFPDGLDTFRRIIGWDVTVSDDGDEEVELILGEEPT